MHHICDLINLEEISKWSEILPRFCAPHFELIYPDSAVQCWRHRQKSKWSDLRQLFIKVASGKNRYNIRIMALIIFRKYVCGGSASPTRTKALTRIETLIRQMIIICDTYHHSHGLGLKIKGIATIPSITYILCISSYSKVGSASEFFQAFVCLYNSDLMYLENGLCTCNRSFCFQLNSAMATTTYCLLEQN